MISASSLQRLNECPASVGILENLTIEQALLGSLVSQPMDYTLAGTEFHDEIAKAIDAGNVPAELRRFLPMNAEAEVSYVLDLRDMQVTRLGVGLDRKYKPIIAELGIPEDMAVPGTLDVIGVDDDGRVIVVDWKTGLEVEDPEFNKQLLIYAFFATLDKGASSAVIRIVYRRGEDSEPYAREFEIDSMMLMAFAAAQRDLPAMIKNAKPEDAKPGSHCRHCEGKPGCPHFHAAVDAARLSAMRDPEIELIIPEHARVNAVEMAEILGPFVKKLNAALRTDMALHGDIKMPDGRLYGIRTKKGNEVINAEKAFPLIEEKYGIVAALAATKKEISKTSLRAAIGLAKDQSQTLAAAERETLKMLRDAGVISNRSDSETVGFVSTKELKSESEA